MHSVLAVRTNLSAKQFRSGGLRRGLHDLDTRGGEHGVERAGEFRVQIPDQEPERGSPLPQVHHQVPRLLGNPPGGRVRADPQDVHPAAADLQHEQDVQALEADRVDVEKAAGQQPAGLGAQEHPPGGAHRNAVRARSRLLRKIRCTAGAPIRYPSRASSPCTRRYPQRGFSLARRPVSATIG